MMYMKTRITTHNLHSIPTIHDLLGIRKLVMWDFGFAIVQQHISCIHRTGSFNRWSRQIDDSTVPMASYCWLSHNFFIFCWICFPFLRICWLLFFLSILWMTRFFSHAGKVGQRCLFGLNASREPAIQTGSVIFKKENKNYEFHYVVKSILFNHSVCVQRAVYSLLFFCRCLKR